MSQYTLEMFLVVNRFIQSINNLIQYHSQVKCLATKVKILEVFRIKVWKMAPGPRKAPAAVKELKSSMIKLLEQFSRDT